MTVTLCLEDMPFPKFTFLCGPIGHGQTELANLIDARPDVCLMEFEEPLRDAIAALFFEGINPEFDLKDPAIRGTSFPGLVQPTPTFGALIGAFCNTLEERCYPGCLGDISLHRLKLEDLFYDHYLYTDCEDHRMVIPFAAEFGPNECLMVWCGPTHSVAASVVSGVRMIICPSDEATVNLDHLNLELRGRYVPER